MLLKIFVEISTIEKSAKVEREDGKQFPGQTRLHHGEHLLRDTTKVRMITVMIFSSYEDFEKVNLCVNIGVMMIMVVVVMMMMVVVVMIVSRY